MIRADKGALIGQGQAWVSLEARNASYYEFTPATFYFRAGCASGQCQTELLNTHEFIEDLASMNRQLSGKASLASVEGELDLEMGFSDSLGSILAEVSIRQYSPANLALTYEIALDQSYLPALLGALQAQFPRQTQS